MHALVALAAGVLLATACNSPQPPPAAGSGSSRPEPAGSATRPPPPPSLPSLSPFQQVRGWAPAAHSVQPAGITVPGMELFKVTPPGAVPPDGVPPYVIVGARGGAPGKVLEREDLMRAAAKATQDAPLLARLAMLVHRKEGELLTAATTDEQRRAKVAAPAIVDQALDFWVQTTGADRTLERGRLDLAAGTVDFTPAGASKPKSPPSKTPPPPPAPR